MRKYSEFQPTGFDCRGLSLIDQQNWLVLGVAQNRDSDILSLSNFAEALKMLGGESETVQVHRFGHWANGWFEIILINPDDAKAVKTADDIESALAGYPVLSDEDYSEREYADYQQSWESWMCRDFARELTRVFQLADSTEYKLDDLDTGKMREFYESLIPSGDYYSENSSRIPYAVGHCTRKQLADFLRANRR
jgi:hypothetical protein